MGNVDLKRLIEIRTQLNYSQKFVALSIGVAPSAVSRWESGEKVPSRENLAKLADLYKVSADYLLGRVDNATADMSPSVRQLMDYVKTVPEDKAAYVLRVMQTILSDESRK